MRAVPLAAAQVIVLVKDCYDRLWYEYKGAYSYKYRFKLTMDEYRFIVLFFGRSFFFLLMGVHCWIKDLKWSKASMQ